MPARARRAAAESQDHSALIAEAREAKESAAAGKRKQKTWYLTEEVIERVNGAAYWALPLALAASQHKNHEIDQSNIPDSASDLVETALWAEVLRLEKLHNQGMPFPEPPSKLRPGPGQSGASRLRRKTNSRGS